MPRPKKPGAPEPKKRSRNGCWPCKARKVKCDETHPTCLNCQRQGEPCDYSIRLNWEGRSRKKEDPSTKGHGQITFEAGMSTFAAPTAVGSSQGVEAQPSSGFSNFHVGQPPAATSTFSSHAAAPRPGQSSRPDMSFMDHHLPGPVDSRSPAASDSQYARSPMSVDSSYSEAYERNPEGANARRFQQPALSRVREASQPAASHSPASSNPGSPASLSHVLSRPTSTPVDAGERDELPGGERPLKRLRNGQSPPDQSRVEMRPPVAAPLSPYALESRLYNTGPSPASTPLTPAGSMTSDEGVRGYMRHSPYISHDSPDRRRLSVNSLLSGPPGMPALDDRASLTPATTTDSYSPQVVTRDSYEDYTIYGEDRGLKDLDIGQNDDKHAISLSASSPAGLLQAASLLQHDSEVEDQVPIEFGFGVQAKDSEFERGGYYAKPVKIKIPKVLEPLPRELKDNPMNLLYFYHFLNHTARVLTPHDCDANPFRHVLPRMALQNPDLMNLLLAYSASHRARLLQQPEPVTRIAMYVQDIFPKLLGALGDHSKMISNTNLATAIMLASLEIISPKAFGVEVPWQQHLDFAREMISSRGGAQTMRDEASSFLLRWFNYLDVLGSLSGGQTFRPRGEPGSQRSPHVVDYHIDDENDCKIDCLFGFTGQCIGILARVADLARDCDEQRIDDQHRIRPEWAPSEAVVRKAERLKELLKSAMYETSPEPCPYMHTTGENSKDQWDNLEMLATNEAFHWAGITQIERRILGKPSTHADVQDAVNHIVSTLWKVRKRSTAAACLVFPMFTAGCDAQNLKQREGILERLRAVEGCGMAHTHKARRLMQKVWDTGQPWETLVEGEWFG